MRRKTKDALKTATQALFEVLGTGAIVTVIHVLSGGRGGTKLPRCFAKYSVWRVRQMLRRLKLRGLIEYDEEDEHSPILLTSKGFIRSTKAKMRGFKGKRWDYLWRIILFDIPDRCKARAAFRYQLQAAGCYRIQRSVYAFPHECKDDILHLASFMKISQHVTVVTAPNLGQHEKAARRFFFGQVE